MKTAKLFKTGGSQAVRLPKECRFEGKTCITTKWGQLWCCFPEKVPGKSFLKPAGSLPQDSWRRENNHGWNNGNRFERDLPVGHQSLHFSHQRQASTGTSELWHGVEGSARKEQNRAALQKFLLPLDIQPYDDNAAQAYGKVRAILGKNGRGVGSMDLLIAAHALSLEATLVTHNLREFRQVPGLTVEDWTLPENG